MVACPVHQRLQGDRFLWDLQGMRGLGLCAALLLVSCTPPAPRSMPSPTPTTLPAVVRGANLRPVGDARRGYGTRTARQTMERLKGLGVNTLGILLEGRLEHINATDIRPPTRDEMEATHQALMDAHALGFATVLVPHLYLDDGRWRGDIKFENKQQEAKWWASYTEFLLQAASLARSTGTSVLSVGVELKGMSNTNADEMKATITKVRGEYDGLLTYSANWDEADNVGFWSALDLAGVNGYYPLIPEPERGAERVARTLSDLAETAGRPVLVLEAGYRSSPLSHQKPWEWPDQVEAAVDDNAQARAWAAVLTHWMGAPGVRGLLVWVIPSDPDDPASEPRHGFNPLNKPAEQVIGRVFGQPS